MTSRSRLTTIESHKHQEAHDHHHESDDEDLEELANTFPVRIFDATYCGEPVPQGFDAVRITIDGTIKSDLSWEKERAAATVYTAQGLQIFWEIDLGLLTFLQHGLGNRTQFLSLTLSLEHFCCSLWQEFRKQTVGLCLYRGPIDFSRDYHWDEEQVLNLQEWIKEQYSHLDSFIDETHIDVLDFSSLTVEDMKQSDVGIKLLKCFCRDAVGEYLSLMASRVPDSLPLFLLFDAGEIQGPMLTARLLTKERYPRFHLAVRGADARAQVLGGEIAWDGTRIERAKLGLCLPRMILTRPSLTRSLSEALDVLIERNIPFRVIPEVNLAAEWDGLDYLVIDTQHVEIQFKRKLQGFCAAGGIVVYIGEPLGFAQEVSFEDFL